ncbi:hypothetical protein ACLESO_40005 [Pyxidicoccus sp. 3LG]
MDLGGGVLGHPTRSGLFVARFDDAGTHRWSRVLDSWFVSLSLGSTPDGGTVVGGTFSRSVIVDGHEYTTPGEQNDLLFLKLAP